MLDPRQLYTVDPEVRESLAGVRPVLIHLLEGYVDAGQVARQLGEHLRDSLTSTALAVFDHDQLHDYRSRRPAMVFDTNTWVSLSDYALVLHKVTDASGQEFLLLVGPEPDTQWNRACAAILDFAQELGVAQLVSAQGVPMGVPHTRPILVTAHATDPSIVESNPVWIDRVTVPGSFAAMLEFRAGERGLLGRGFVPHVPHYLAPGTYAPAALAALEQVRDATGLDLPPGELASLATQTLAQLEGEVAGDGELGPMVEQLERQYDELEASGRTHVPSVDEIGKAVEQFLAQQGDEDSER
ncbi:MAG: PAC2 family protein [Propionibacteriaceae bacterium]|nr:PAC2 family protein [Propionibacteriaceae bacterium]